MILHQKTVAEGKAKSNRHAIKYTRVRHNPQEVVTF